jgi:glycosyltransferase involved in cell wall biosynthesis
MKRITILHTTTTIGKSSFGIGQISVSLAQAQYEIGQNVEIWCLDNEESINWASKTHGFPSKFIKGYKLFGPEKLWFSPDIKKKARQTEKGDYNIIHQHGIWTGTSKATLTFAQKKIPTIVAPHGSLNKWVLDISAWKKRIALTAYERKNLELASCLHATSENEVADFRNFGLKNPIAYIENGIQKKNLYIKGNANRFREQYGIEGDKRILLFLSRISPKKGLIMLVNAINSIRNVFDSWQLIIAGVDEFDHKRDVELLIRQLNLTDRIKIIGPLFNDSKNDAFEAAELFILPSHSEGSPMVVLDSLAAGVPVVTTKASSWEDLNKYDCGWWSDINSSSITNCLKEALSYTEKDLQEMGQKGKKLISEKYTWDKLANKTLELYGWLLKEKKKPDFVILN